MSPCKFYPSIQGVPGFDAINGISGLPGSKGPPGIKVRQRDIALCGQYLALPEAAQ